MSTAPLFLGFDGYNLVRRVYGAVPGDDTIEKVEGVFKSSIATFKRTLNDFKPSHVLVAFDAGGHTFRHDMYPAYREGRKPMPDVLKDAMPKFHDMLREIGLQVVVVPGIEADDVLGGVSLKWMSKRFGRAIIVSTDKDLAQMSKNGVEVWNCFDNKFLNDAWCQAKFGIPLEKIGDFLALMGDASDGIPGVPKVGVKTAAKLLNEYGDMAGVLANAENVPGAIGQRLRDNIDNAKLSRELVRLKTDVMLNMSWKQIVYDGQKKSALN